MRNIFRTPEGKEFIFIIPENAQADENGFYVINKELKEANPHIDFDYLSFDLEHRGLQVDSTFYDRNDYLAGKISHGDYYLQFINLKTMPSAIQRFIGDAVLLASEDEHLNDIPMRRWDDFPSKQYIYTAKYKAADNASYSVETQARNPFLWSPSANVCFAKTCARIVIERLKNEAATK
jgi:hypothetical protein